MCGVTTPRADLAIIRTLCPFASPEQWDPNFEPTEADMKEYANVLGLQMPADNDLLWICRAGLKAKLPDDWKVRQTKRGGVPHSA